MIRLILAVAAGLGGGFVSAFLPIVNAEALAGAGSIGMNVGTALAVAFAVALGQTAGKVVIYEAARRGSGSLDRFWRRWRSRRRVDDRGAIVLGAGVGDVEVTDVEVTDVEVTDVEVTDVERLGKVEPGSDADGSVAAAAGDVAATDSAPSPERAETRRWRRSLRWLQRPRAAGAIVLMSASVGVPPLAVVSAAAGVARTPRLLFALTCLVGRSVRFGVLAVLVGVTTA